MSVRNPGDVRVENENEAALVNQLVRAINAAFTASDLLNDLRKEEKVFPREMLAIRQAEHHIAKLNIGVARAYLCRGIELSRRRGELIFLAGHMADAGVLVDASQLRTEDDGPEVESEDPELDRASEHAAAIEAQAPCAGCGTIFVDADALAEHQPCIKEQVDAIYSGTGDDLTDDAEVLDAQAGGNEFDLPY
jgi:hypothetical protein